jgi:acyl-CoA synthetase (AMP-forming)/AMP-acid ligase II
MTPYRFLRRPAAWLKAISEFRGTISPAPNFAYALVQSRMSDTELAELDLSSWRGALCGSEQVDVGNLLRFAERFGGCGFDAHSLTPCYGMAEASLAVTIHRPGDALRFEHVLRATLASEGRAVPASEAQADGTIVVCGCGSALPGVRLSVCDESGKELPEGSVGEIWIQSPSLTIGYVADPDRTRDCLRDGWLLSGDLGYLRDGHLFVTGRRKELIVIRGHNYHPADFEWAAAEVPGVRSGKVVAFSAYSPEQATEQLYVVCERPQDAQWTDEALTEAIRAQVARRTGLLPVVGLLPRNAIPKTTSGKLQRGKVKERYLSEASA